MFLEVQGYKASDSLAYELYEQFLMPTGNYLYIYMVCKWQLSSEPAGTSIIEAQG